MKYRFIPLILISLALAACQGQKETIREQIAMGPQTQGCQGNCGSGGADTGGGGADMGGGGNSVAGKPIDEYIESLESREVYRDLVQPVIMNIAAVHPRLASDMLHIVKDRSWYWVPADLNKLDPRVIGSYFGADQIALQNLRAVWVSTKVFDTLSSKDSQAIFLIHELLIGIQLMQYQMPLDECLAGIALLSWDRDDKGQQTKRYAEARNRCYRENSSLGGGEGFTPGKRFKIEDAQYDMIRLLAKTMFDQKGKIDPVETQNILKAYKIRVYPGAE